MARTRTQQTVFRMAATGTAAEILVYGDIGVDPWTGEGIGSEAFVQTLASLPADVETLVIRINSRGGVVFEGNAIYTALMQYPAHKIVRIDALAASAATVIAMAGDTIEIAPTAMMMVHNASAICFGDQNAMTKMAKRLTGIRDAVMQGAYSRTKLSTEELTAIMDEETWYTAKEAVAAGWADKIMETPSRDEAARMRFDLSAFKHPPKELAVANADCDAADAEAILAPKDQAAAHDEITREAANRERKLKLAERI